MQKSDLAWCASVKYNVLFMKEMGKAQNLLITSRENTLAIKLM